LPAAQQLGEVAYLSSAFKDGGGFYQRQFMSSGSPNIDSKTQCLRSAEISIPYVHIHRVRVQRTNRSTDDQQGKSDTKGGALANCAFDFDVTAVRASNHQWPLDVCQRDLGFNPKRRRVRGTQFPAIASHSENQTTTYCRNIALPQKRSS
jgi:hypothetical protein